MQIQTHETPSVTVIRVQLRFVRRAFLVLMAVIFTIIIVPALRDSGVNQAAGWLLVLVALAWLALWNGLNGVGR